MLTLSVIIKKNSQVDLMFCLKYLAAILSFSSTCHLQSWKAFPILLFIHIKHQK